MTSRGQLLGHLGNHMGQRARLHGFPVVKTCALIPTRVQQRKSHAYILILECPVRELFFKMRTDIMVSAAQVEQGTAVVGHLPSITHHYCLEAKTIINESY